MPLQYSWKSQLVNWVLLSIMIQLGTPNLQTIDLRKATAAPWVMLTTEVGLWPLCELVNGDKEESVPTDGPREWSQDIHPPYSE
jgi:hypothetical protein